MAKRFNKDDAVYFPVKIAEVEYEDRWYDYVVRGIGADGTKDGFPFCVKDEEVKTAEEVADGLDLIARATLEEYTEKAERKIRSLEQQLADANELLSDAQDKVRELTETDCMRVQEFKPIIEERDRLKADVAARIENVKNLVEENDQLKKLADDLGDENEKLKAELEQEKKRTQVWKDSSEEHRQRAEELEGDVNRYGMEISDYEMKLQKLGQENDSLKADILELKAQINVFGSKPSEIDELKAERDSARGQADLFKTERDELDAKVQKHSDIFRRWSKKIHSQEASIKEKDLIISMLAAMVLELKGGESNG